MDELTYEETLKLQNSKEHLKNVLSNVRIANSELTQVYEELHSVRELIAKAKKDRDSILETASTLSIELDEKKGQLERKEVSLLERENKLIEIDKQSEERIEKANRELESIENQIIKVKSENNNLIQMYSSIITDLNEKLSDARSKLGETEDSIEAKDIILSTIERDIAELESRKSDLEVSLKKLTVYLEKEMSDVQVRIEEEKDKIRGPLELLGLETDKLNKRLKDFAIIKARLTQQFRSLNPDKLIPIELQNE